MKLKCIKSSSKSFVVGAEYETITTKGYDAFRRMTRITKIVSGDDWFDMEIRPIVAFNKRGKVIAEFEQIIKVKA